MRTLRFLFQLFFIELILYHAVLFSLGASYKNCETYCPFGAVETMALFVKTAKFPCAVNEFNYSMLAGVLILTILFKRVFCSWVCPLGAVNELITVIRGRFNKYKAISANILNPLYSIKYILLIVIIAATYRHYDLVFRPYCPYFTAFGLHGHTTETLSYFILTNALLITFFIKLGFCRTLCPLGAFLNLFNTRNVFKIYRDEAKCVNCKLCDGACLNEIKISEAVKIDSRGCTMCLNCISACPENNALKIGF